MEYRIEDGTSFSVIGQEVKLGNRQLENVAISREFWKKFNIELKKNYLSQFGNWTKYAFTYKKGDELFYYCAIPKRVVIPEGFVQMDISKQKYLVVEHRGSMDSIYQTYHAIYKEIIPQNQFVVNKEQFLHFEKYSDRFHWNHENSVIEIWVPVEYNAK